MGECSSIDNDQDVHSSSESDDCHNISKIGKRSWQKEHVCLFCFKGISKMARHLISCHRTENDVAKVVVLPPKSLERRNIFETIMRAGDYYHNLEVLETRKGSIIVLRRPSYAQMVHRNIQPKDYVPCPACLGFVLRSDLWRHAKRCKVTSECKVKERLSVLQASQLLLYNVSNPASEAFNRNILCNMNNDDLTDIARNDWLIMHLGTFLYEQHGVTQRRSISQHMRMLSKLLIEIRVVTENKRLKMVECISPAFFDHIVTAVRKVCVINMPEHSRPQLTNSPSFALKVGHDLKK